MTTLIECTCWCERESKLIPVDWVSAGMTDSCGPGCVPGCPTTAEPDHYDDEPPAPGPRKKMNRMTTQSYDPADDSSPGFAAVRAEYPHALILVRESGLCPCGCGEAPRGSKATFAMGHDIRLRGKLTRAHAAYYAVVWVTPDGAVEQVDEDAARTAAEFSTPKLDWESAVRDSASKIRVRSRSATQRTREAAEAAVLQAAQVGRDGLSLVRLGRSEELGSVVAVYQTRDETTWFDYVGTDGQRRYARQRVDGTLEEAEQIGAAS